MRLDIHSDIFDKVMFILEFGFISQKNVKIKNLFISFFCYD